MNAVINRSVAKLALAAAAVCPFALSHADRVGQLDGTPQIVVEYDDLDISNTRGLETLYDRIQLAAASVCGYDRLHKELSRQRRPSACYEAAVDNAIEQVNQPMLTALHRAKGRTRVG
jgi:UrcA family protein